MALTPLLFDAYQKYKRGTEDLVHWLAETARATGTVNEVFSDSQQHGKPPTGGRLKGSARKAAKNAPATYHITARSFVALATAIANDARASVPTSVFGTLQAVIRGRKDCAVWYASTSDCADNAVKENNASHQYFIKTLEDVLEILKAVKRPPVERRQPKTTKAEAIRTSNKYELLENEALPESDHMPEIIEVHATPAKSKVTYKLEESETDVTFAIYCFLMDVTDLRIAVRRTWREFANGDIGLQAAALTMNVALTMIEKLSNDFEESNPRFKDSNGHLVHSELIGFLQRSRSKVEPGSPFVNAPNDCGEPFAYKQEKQSLSFNTVVCNHVTELLLFTFSDITKNEECRYSNDEKRFLKCVSQLAASPSIEPRFMGEYMVRKAAFAMLREGRLQSWIFFSLQIFWDMQRELERHLSVGEELLYKIGQQIITAYQAYIDVKGFEELDDFYTLCRESVIDRKEFVEAFIVNKKAQMAFDIDEEQLPLKFRKMPGFSLLRCDPAFCGVLLATMCKEHHEVAIECTSNDGQIIVMAHLYNAAQCAGHLPEDLRWADMDHLIEQQGSDWIFMGKKPHQDPEFGRRVLLIMGNVAHDFTKGWRPRTVGSSSTYVSRVSGTRRLSYHSQYLESSVDRMPRDKTHQKVKTLEKWREQRQKGPVHDDGPRKDTLVKLELLVGDAQKKSHNPHKTLSSLEKLRIFKEVVSKDETALTFDVLQLHMRCTQVLLQIHKYARKVAPVDYPAFIFQGHSRLTIAIPCMLYNWKKNQPHHPCIFPVVGIMLRKMIEKEGDSALKDAAALQKSMKVKFPGYRRVDEPSFETPLEDLIPVQLRTEFPYSMYWQVVQERSGNSGYGSRYESEVD
ncbi:hypothetical protein J4E81_003535 [Alternaria sp. BMP 2799]|nr:hypothetical protein J4E81_003535 [Alternaria sp. BMP 2799]